MGSAATHLCLGPGWSTMCNTPFRRHKIWTHEGGTSTPLVVHWPRGIAAKGELRHDAGHVVDLMPTILDAAGAPAAKISASAPDFPGRSSLPAFARNGSVQHDYLFHHQGNRGLRVGPWKLVSSKDDAIAWELYDFTNGRYEQHNLITAMPRKAEELKSKWEALEAQFAKDAADQGLTTEQKTAADAPSVSSVHSVVQPSSHSQVLRSCKADRSTFGCLPPPK